jgi:hypothetical protein
VFVAESVFEEISGDDVCVEVRELVGSGLVEIGKGSNFELLDLLSSSLGKGCKRALDGAFLVKYIRRFSLIGIVGLCVDQG